MGGRKSHDLGLSRRMSRLQIRLDALQFSTRMIAACREEKQVDKKEEEHINRKLETSPRDETVNTNSACADRNRSTTGRLVLLTHKH